jgi:hypothetical protein
MNLLEAHTNYGVGRYLMWRDCTLVCASSIFVSECEHALQRCMEFFPFSRVVFFTDKRIPGGGFNPFWNLNRKKITVIHRKLLTREEYSLFIIRELHAYVSTPFVMIVQHDGYILHPLAFDPAFFDYDYIGAPWPGYNGLVGNGGFSIRSYRLLKLTSRIPSGWGFPEDTVTCMFNRGILNREKIRIAPTELAERFAFEHKNSVNHKLETSFGFHGTHLLPVVNPNHSICNYTSP